MGYSPSSSLNLKTGPLKRGYTGFKVDPSRE